jgi:hypothetical protein
VNGVWCWQAFRLGLALEKWALGYKGGWKGYGVCGFLVGWVIRHVIGQVMGM